MAADTGAQINMDSVAQPGHAVWWLRFSESVRLLDYGFCEAHVCISEAQEEEKQWLSQQLTLLRESGLRLPHFEQTNHNKRTNLSQILMQSTEAHVQNWIKENQAC